MKRENYEKAFFDAYDRYADAIYRHCFFRVYSKERAEELVQETFLRTWEYLESGKEVENIRAFLYRVAGNLVIDASRKKKEFNIEDVLDEDDSREPSYDERGSVETRMMFRDVFETMQRLSEEDRDIITLRYLDELEPREIAVALGVSANVASVRLNRALARLRLLLKEE